jgi:hypothetical protein
VQFVAVLVADAQTKRNQLKINNNNTYQLTSSLWASTRSATTIYF